MSGGVDLNDLLRAEPSDPGCDGSARLFELFAEATVIGMSTEGLFPDVAAHLRGCTACREEMAGLVEAIMSFGDPHPAVGCTARSATRG